MCVLAQMLVLEKAEALQEEAEFMLDGLKSAQFHASPGLGEVLLNSSRLLESDPAAGAGVRAGAAAAETDRVPVTADRQERTTLPVGTPRTGTTSGADGARTTAAGRREMSR